MIFSINGRAAICTVLSIISSLSANVLAQNARQVSDRNEVSANSIAGNTSNNRKDLIVSVLPRYHSQTNGFTLGEIIKRTFESNGDLRIAMLEVDRAKARLQQASLRPNPSFQYEQSVGKLAGSPGENSLSAGVSMPLEIFGQRKRRTELAMADIDVREAEVAVLKRELANRVFSTYAEALASLKDLEVLERLLELDTETARFVQIRVNEGEVAPLEINLLQAEIERLRARLSLIEGKLQTSISRLKFYANLPETETLRLREDISTALLPNLPDSIETSIELALRTRPEIRLAELQEQFSGANLRLINSQANPDFAAQTGFSQGRSMINDPRGPFPNSDRSISFGVTVGIPLFDRKQGAKAEAAIAIQQAQERKIFSRQIVRNEVVTASQRFEAAKKAVTTLETFALPRSMENVETMRKIYEIGEVKITDLINEQKRLLDANRDLTEALTERYKAQADLFIAIGLTLER